MINSLIKNDVMSSILKGLRAKNRLTLQEVADKTGYNKETIRLWEKNPLKKDTDKILLLLEVYNEPVDIFFKQCMTESH